VENIDAGIRDTKNRFKFKVVYIIIILVIIVSVIIILFNTNNTNITHQSDKTGLAVHPIYPAYSSPESRFTISSSTMNVADTAIYKTAYVSLGGGAWQALTVNGAPYQESTNWISGVGTINIPVLPNNTESYIIVYSCARINNNWDCHDNKWQLTEFNISIEPTCSDGIQNQDETNIDCGGSCSACIPDATCTDGIQNQNEAGIDCGGICQACQTIPQANYYVATNGNDSNPGTIDRPFATWQKGFNMAQAGNLVYIRGGVYYPSNLSGVYGVRIDKKSGNASNYIKIWAYPNEKPILDVSLLTGTYLPNFGVFIVDSNYWYLKGLEVRGARQVSPTWLGNGIAIKRCNNTILEELVSHNNQGPGFSISYAGTNNSILNCDSYDNYDPYTTSPNHPGGNADGFVIPYGVKGNINTLKGCRSWNNSDDGYDTWQNDGIVIFDHCWAFSNGIDQGDGNGFKLGPLLLAPETFPQRIVTNSISAKNRAIGFDQNDASALMTLYNSIAYDNIAYGFSFGGGNPNAASIFRNNIAYSNIGGNAAFNSNMIRDHNSWDSGFTVTDSDFVNLNSSLLYSPRNSDGSLPDIDFLKLASGSNLIDAGVDVGLPYNGTAPDIGAFETN